MTHSRRDEAAVAAIAEATRRAWPARVMEKFAPGWANLFLVALRVDPEGRAAVAAALLDEEDLARALAAVGVLERPIEDVQGLAREIITALDGAAEDAER